MEPTGASKDPRADDVDLILTGDDIGKLRAGYHAEQMNDIATQFVNGPYEGARDFVRFVRTHFYERHTMAPDRREQVLIGLIAYHSGGTGAFLALHMYWGIVEGLSVTTIAETLLLTGAYTGIPNYAAGIGTLGKTVRLLKEICDDTQNPGRVECESVPFEILAAFK